jgi:hypothetical protein
MKILYFYLFLWVIFALLDPDPRLNADPDPATQINADPDPDPQPCYLPSQATGYTSSRVLIHLAYCLSVPSGLHVGLESCWLYTGGSMVTSPGHTGS